jgi:outer membrane protein assembly factor BamA
MLNSKSVFLGVLLFFSMPSFAQFGNFGSSRDTSNKPFKLAAFPYINYDRTQDLMYGAVAMGMFKFNNQDTVSPKSMVGVMGLGTTTKSWGSIGFASLYWKEDSWRALLAGGYFSFNFQFYWNPFPQYGTFIRYNSGYSVMYGKLERRVTKPGIREKLFVGLHGMYAKANTTFDVLDSVVVAPKTNLNAVGLLADFDSRDDVYYPEKGYLVEANWKWFASWLGNNNPFNNVELNVNNYKRIHKRVIQASRFHGSFSLGNVPFEGQQILGQTDIRGYSLGKQRGDQLLAIQTESRVQVLRRLFLVAFVGVGTTTSSWSDFSFDNLWPGAGGGFRYRVMEKEKFNIGIDLAAGRGDWSMAFTLGESF